MEQANDREVPQAHCVYIRDRDLSLILIALGGFENRPKSTKAARKWSVNLPSNLQLYRLRALSSKPDTTDNENFATRMTHARQCFKFDQEITYSLGLLFG